MKNQIKAIMCDLDGTLLTDKKTILPQTKQALLEAQQKGYTLILASSRSLYMLQEIIDQLEMKKYGGYAICLNGCQAIQLSSGKLWEAQSFTVDQVNKIFDYVKSKKLFVGFESEKAYQFYLPLPLKWMLPAYYFIHTKQKSALKRNVAFHLFGDFRFHPEQTITMLKDKSQLQHPVQKCGYIRLFSNIDQSIKEMRDYFGDELDVVKISRVWADIMPGHISKATGIGLIQDELGFGLESIMAFGDAENDLKMLQEASLGIAMGNAAEIVKSVADEVTLDNNQNGIAYALYKHKVI